MQRDSGLQRWLQIPFLYNSLQDAIDGNAVRRRYSNRRHRPVKWRTIPMTNTQSQRHSALDSLALLALVITFLLRYTPFLASRLLFGPFLDNVYIYGPIFSEVSRLSLSAAVPYYLPDIGTGFPVFESPHFSILYPFYFFRLLNYGGPLESLYTLTHLTLLHIFVFYLNLYVLLLCSIIPPGAAYVGG